MKTNIEDFVASRDAFQRNKGDTMKIPWELCNVPTLGHHHSVEIYDDQSSQMDARVSTGVFERHCGSILH